LNKIVSTKNTNAIFLATVLVLGTIALSSPSFMTNASAQSESYYDRMDDRYSNYEPTEYLPEYTDKKYSSHEPDYVMDNNNNYQKPYGEDRYGPTEYPDNNYYNSYGYSDYGKDSSYDDRKSYDKKPYGNDNGYDKSQYQSSYKPDYKSKYPSYEKDNNYKSKDSISVNLNKLNCINNNVNINGNNNGTINVGNSGKSATGSGTDEGYLGVGSLGGNYGEGYDNGYNKQKDKSFLCIINNNNNNTNIIAGGNQTEPEPEPTPCENCFSSLSPTEINEFLTELTPLTPNQAPIQSLTQFCAILDILVPNEQTFSAIQAALVATTGVSIEELESILFCLERLGLIVPPV